MKLSWGKAFFVTCVLVLVAAASVFSQDAEKASAPAEDASAPIVATDLGPEAKEIAIYGEVQTIDPAANNLSIQYYDYDSDSEKTIDIFVGSAAKLENASGLSSVKKGDWADVTYVVNDGKNEAKVVTVEKEEVLVSEDTSAQAAAPTSIPQE